MRKTITRLRHGTTWAIAGAQCLLTIWLLVWCSGSAHTTRALTDRQYWELVVAYSEPEQTFAPSGGYQSDNLVSNERSFQAVVPQLHPRPRAAYIGVGPEQNFTYIAALQPDVAFIVDIRRDNLLLHLLYKALAETSADRAGFLSELFARPLLGGGSQRLSASALFDALMRTPPAPQVQLATSLAVQRTLTLRHGFRLSATDLRRIDAIHRAFVRAGPRIRWGDEERPWMPTFAELMGDADGDGVSRSFLASEDMFQRFATLERENRIVPLVGDFGGTRTFGAIGRYLRLHHLVVAAFYASNVEPYLKQRYTQFAANLAGFPVDHESLFIRTRFAMVQPPADRPDYTTTTTAVPILDVIR